VGAALSSVSTMLATLGSIDQVPMCSYWSSSPALSNKEAYPMFARSYPSDAATTRQLPVVLKEFGWATIGVVHANDGYANAYAEGLRQSTDISVVVSSSFEREQPHTYEAALQALKAARVNIIVAIVFDADAVGLLQAARQLAIFGQGFAWITSDATTLSGAATAAITNGVPEQEAYGLLDGLLNFYVSPQRTAGFDRLTSAWTTAAASECENDAFEVGAHHDLFGASPFPVAAYSYDCVVSLAIAATRVAGGPANASGLSEQLLHATFDGASGEMHFDQQSGDRAITTVDYVLENWQLTNGDAPEATVAATLSGGVVNMSSVNIRWPGGGAQPSDRFDTDVTSYLPRELVLPGISITAICIAIGCAFGVWTVCYRHSRVVKSSQPGFLCAIVVGSLLSLSAIIPAGLDHRGMSSDSSTMDEDTRFPSLDFACNLQAGLYSIGFMITFTSLLAKLWRILRVVNATTISTKDAPPPKLPMMLTGLLVGGQALAMVLMWAIAPLHFKLTIERVHGFAVNSYGACDVEDRTTSTFLVVTLFAQFLLLCYANVLCYRARKIPSEYAEGKYVAIACANHLQTKSFAILAASFTYNEPQVTFLVKWLALTVSDFGTLCLVFVPKIWMLYNNGSSAMVDAKHKLRAAAVDIWTGREKKEELAVAKKNRREEKAEARKNSTTKSTATATTTASSASSSHAAATASDSISTQTGASLRAFPLRAMPYETEPKREQLYVEAEPDIESATDVNESSADDEAEAVAISVQTSSTPNSPRKQQEAAKLPSSLSQSGGGSPLPQARSPTQTGSKRRSTCSSN